jgi:hypothetical protein
MLTNIAHRLQFPLLLASLAAAGGCFHHAASVVALPCTNPIPAPLGRADPLAPGYFVMFRSGTDPDTLTAQLAARLHFIPRRIYRVGFRGFFADSLSPATLGALRCEPAVALIDRNHVISTMTSRPDRGRLR